MPRKFIVFIVALLVGAIPHSARADLGDAVNWARVAGCDAPLHRTLRDNPQLRQAAARLASGMPLHETLAGLGYVARQSSALHVSGATADSQVGSLLVAHYCRIVTDPDFTEYGILRRGRDVWIVLASPVSLPSSRDPAVVGRQLQNLVNAARLSGRVCGRKTFASAAPLRLDATLTRAALAHSADMAASGDFDHLGSDRSTPVSRVQRAGYGSYIVVGENIAAGAMTPAEVTQGWLDSPPHCENIMDPRFTEIGIGVAVNPSSAQLMYWTEDFAAPGHGQATRARTTP